jgi:hypothetical protein
MSDGITIALVGLLAAIAGGLIQAWTARIFERHRFFRDNKREVYGRFLSGLSTLSVYGPGTQQQINSKANVVETRCQIALFGSDEVVKTVGLVFNHDNFFSDEAQRDLANAVSAMRRDTGLKVTPELAQNLLQLLFGAKGKGAVTWN